MTIKPFDLEIVSGSRLRSVWKLSWPLMLLNLINGIHGFIDHILIGHFVGTTNNAANAAIGVAWQVFLVIVVFIASIFHGMNVLIARYTGKQDRETLSEIFYSAFVFSFLCLQFILAPVGFFIAPYLLRAVDAVPEVERHALPYLRLLFSCGTPLFLLFLLTGAFHASGEPKIPLKLGILTTVLNVIISTVCIVGIGPIPPMGVLGAGLGTVLSPLVSCIVALYLIFRKKMIIQPPQQIHFRPNLHLIGAMIRIGTPTGIQGVLLNIGGVVLLWYIGSLPFGAAAQAAYTIGYAQLFSLITWTSFGLRAASSTLMGQNMGAGDTARGKECVLTAAGLGMVWASLIGILFWMIPGSLLRLFNAVHEPVYGYGINLMRFLAISGIMVAATQALTGGLQGAGATRPPMLIAFATQIVALLGLCQLFTTFGMLTATTIWSSIIVSHALRLLMTAFVFSTQGWTKVQSEPINGDG